MSAQDLDALRYQGSTYVDRLQALRGELIDRLESAPASAVPGIAKVLLETMNRLEAVAPEHTEDSVDELSAARARRRANAGL